MSFTTGVEWAKATWNPWQGCNKITKECKNCYMFREMLAYGRPPDKIIRSKDVFNLPLKKTRNGQYKLAPRDRVFVCSWSDFWHQAADPWRPDAFAIIRQRPDLIYIIPTKRPENIADRLPRDWGKTTLYDNIWLLISAGDEDFLRERWPIIQKINAKVIGISYEPALGYLNLARTLRTGNYRLPDWVIAGGETDDYKPRPAHTDWFRQARNDCTALNIPFFFKQWGSTIHSDQFDQQGFYHMTQRFPFGSSNADVHQWPDRTYSWKLDKYETGKKLDGQTHLEYPAFYQQPPSQELFA